MRTKYRIDFRTEVGHRYEYVEVFSWELPSYIRKIIIDNEGSKIINVTTREYITRNNITDLGEKVLFTSAAEVRTILKY